MAGFRKANVAMTETHGVAIKYSSLVYDFINVGIKASDLKEIPNIFSLQILSFSLTYVQKLSIVINLLRNKILPQIKSIKAINWQQAEVIK